jgi:hypothetical protein
MHIIARRTGNLPNFLHKLSEITLTITQCHSGPVRVADFVRTKPVH